MRIISGNLKGRKIAQPNSNNTRPLKDLTKESIFNIMEHSNLLKFSFEKSTILDLFSGVGSFGLECISRGVKSVIFFENYSETLKILKKNIYDLNCEKKSQIIEEDIFKIKSLNYLHKEKFEVIFLDPPYKEKKIFGLINSFSKKNILKKNGIIIIHRNNKSKDNFPRNFNILDTRKYGISKIIFGTLTS